MLYYSGPFAGVRYNIVRVNKTTQQSSKVLGQKHFVIIMAFWTDTLVNSINKSYFL